MSSGSGLHLPSGTSTVTRHVKLCCWRDRFSVGNSLRTVTVGAGMGFLLEGFGLVNESNEWRSSGYL